MSKKLKVTPLDLLLPYQLAWVRDDARFKIWLKSRQIGGSLAASFEVVADALETGGDWVILSAGERQALEFMDKVQRAASIFCDAISYSTGKEYRPEVQKSQLRFPNGARVLALPANPATARGYSANLVLDEFAFHENPEEIWRAVYPIISNPLRGALKLRVISTPAGRNNKYFDLWENAPAFSRHKTTVYDAVASGLALNIDELRANLADPDGWAQEFECQFMEHSSQVFPADLVRACESDDASLDAPEELFSRESRIRPALFVGIDVGRKRDLTVAWTLERIHGGHPPHVPSLPRPCLAGWAPIPRHHHRHRPQAPAHLESHFPPRRDRPPLPHDHAPRRRLIDDPEPRRNHASGAFRAYSLGLIFLSAAAIAFAIAAVSPVVP